MEATHSQNEIQMQHSLDEFDIRLQVGFSIATNLVHRVQSEDIGDVIPYFHDQLLCTNN